MTDCVITSPETILHEADGPPCVIRGQHAPACADEECAGCRPSPAAPNSLACTWHHDSTRDMLTGATRERTVPSLADLYEALADQPVGARGAGDEGDAQVISDQRRQARSAIKAMLVSWCLLLAEPVDNGGRGLTVPDERVIAVRTARATVWAETDRLVTTAAWRAETDDAERARLAGKARAYGDQARRLRDQRTTEADVIAALADHIDRHLAWLLASEHASQLVHEVTFAWRWAWALAGGGRRLPTIRCSCGGLVPMALAEDPGERAAQTFQCPNCGEWGVLDWWRTREGSDPGPMLLADLVPWLAEWHGLDIPLGTLRRWAARRPVKGEHEESCTGYSDVGLTCTGCVTGPGLLVPVGDDGQHVPEGPRQGRALRYDPHAVAVVARRMASEGRLRSA